MAGAGEVGELFNAKASGWRRKYAAGGPLAVRIAEFEARLARRIAAPADVLELGCGTGNLSARLAELGHRVVACDIAERMLEEAKRAFTAAPIRWVLLAPAWERLPVDGSALDAVVASSVFEYLDRLVPVLAECRRVLKPNGLLLFTVPNPEARVRRLEALVRPLAVLSSALPLPRRLSRLDRYAQYLRLSKNRLTIDGWQRTLAQAGFRPASDGLRLPGAFGSRSSSLMLLAFERVPGE